MQTTTKKSFSVLFNIKFLSKGGKIKQQSFIQDISSTRYPETLYTDTNMLKKATLSFIHRTHRAAFGIEIVQIHKN